MSRTRKTATKKAAASKGAKKAAPARSGSARTGSGSTTSRAPGRSGPRRTRRASAPTGPPSLLAMTSPRPAPLASERAVITPLFGDLQPALLRFISDSPAIVGCIAWMTDRDVIAALAARDVALLVQKESWWKGTALWATTLRQRYEALHGGLRLAQMVDPAGSGRCRPTGKVLPAIGCVGHNDSSPYKPLMHHKFLVRCRLDERGYLSPEAVWTGSFNFTSTARTSLENAVVIEDPVVARAYLDEFVACAPLAESMRWAKALASRRGAGTGGPTAGIAA